MTVFRLAALPFYRLIQFNGGNSRRKEEKEKKTRNGMKVARIDTGEKRGNRER